MGSFRTSAATRIVGLSAALACLGAACSFGAGGVRPETPAAGPTATTAADTSTTSSPSPPGEVAAAYGFTFEQQVTSGADSWSLAASGRVVGTGLTCRVQVAGPGMALDHELVLVGDRLWSRDHGSGEYREVGGGNPAERALLAYCPAWPTTAAAAGLSGLAAGEPARHVVSGVEALGYRADTAGLAGAIGADLGTAVAETFNFWVAADGGRLLEVNLSVSGPGADLGPLLGSLPVPAGQATVTTRHRLDLGVSTDPIAPPA
jgi:hypothetical protein